MASEQLALLSRDGSPSLHGPHVDVQTYRYVMVGKVGPEERVLTWERYRCLCGDPSCDRWWQRG